MLARQLLPQQPPLALPLARPEGEAAGGRAPLSPDTHKDPSPEARDHRRPGYHLSTLVVEQKLAVRLLRTYPCQAQSQGLRRVILLFKASPALAPPSEVQLMVASIFTDANTEAPGVAAGLGTANREGPDSHPGIYKPQAAAGTDSTIVALHREPPRTDAGRWQLCTPVMRQPSSHHLPWTLHLDRVTPPGNGGRGQSLRLQIRLG